MVRTETIRQSVHVQILSSSGWLAIILLVEGIDEAISLILYMNPQKSILLNALRTILVWTNYNPIVLIFQARFRDALIHSLRVLSQLSGIIWFNIWEKRSDMLLEFMILLTTFLAKCLSIVTFTIGACFNESGGRWILSHVLIRAWPCVRLAPIEFNETAFG